MSNHPRLPFHMRIATSHRRLRPRPRIKTAAQLLAELDALLALASGPLYRRPTNLICNNRVKPVLQN